MKPTFEFEESNWTFPLHSGMYQNLYFQGKELRPL